MTLRSESLRRQPRENYRRSPCWADGEFIATLGPAISPVINKATRIAAADTLAAIKAKNTSFGRLFGV